MARRTVLARLDDILKAIRGIEDVVAANDETSFLQDFITQKAVERCLEIVSEASRHIPEKYKSSYPEIPWQQIRAIGNRIRHEYDGVDNLVIWKTATVSVGQLKPAIQAMIERAQREGA